ncbi:hypothetical protein [Streptomyces sp. RG80]|uniref:hypothetical protein n=1 Tax=Streptomyces sp. RG80 TaxID=3157340 RepID=UPI00338F3D35
MALSAASVVDAELTAAVNLWHNMHAMRSRSRIGTVISGIAAATLLTITNASAVDGDERATGTTDPGTSAFCTPDGSWAQACFYAYGDWFGVDDTYEDGLSAVVDWYLTTPLGEKTRSGRIWNPDGSNAGWRFKNKDFTEGYWVYLRHCRGSYSTLNVQAGSCSTWHATKA